MTILAVSYMAVKLIINIYCTRTIITLDLYFFYPLAVYNVERFISMTQLLLHTFAHLTGPSFRVKAKLLPNEFFLGLV